MEQAKLSYVVNRHEILYKHKKTCVCVSVSVMILTLSRSARGAMISGDDITRLPENLSAVTLPLTTFVSPISNSRPPFHPGLWIFRFIWVVRLCFVCFFGTTTMPANIKKRRRVWGEREQKIRGETGGRKRCEVEEPECDNTRQSKLRADYTQIVSPCPPPSPIPQNWQNKSWLEEQLFIGFEGHTQTHTRAQTKKRKIHKGISWFSHRPNSMMSILAPSTSTHSTREILDTRPCTWLFTRITCAWSKPTHRKRTTPTPGNTHVFGHRIFPPKVEVCQYY